MKKIILLLFLIFSLGAVACTATEDVDNGSVSSDTISAENNGTQTTRLDEDYRDALPIMTQLAAGTLELDETDLAVDATLAAELLPLWQAAQSLSNSDTAASVEVNAVLNQIQDTMSPAQIEAIAAMALTADSMAELLESGTITFGRGAGQGNQGEDGGFTPRQGGGPGAGGGLGRPGGGPGGLGGAELSEDAIATRQAEIASGEGVGQLQEQAVVGAVVRLLQTKTGVEVERPGAGLVDAVYTAVSSTIGLDVETIEAGLIDGGTLLGLIEENGGDVTAVREAIIANLNTLPNAADLDVEQIADSWLSE